MWGDEHQITAVELNPHIAAVYKQFFPRDEVLAQVDAHKYLELVAPNADFDFIWSSPPCQTHSRRNFAMGNVRYADMSLWQEIIFLERLGKVKKELRWVVENVVPYYKPLIPASFRLGRHLFWSNITDCSEQDDGCHIAELGKSISDATVQDLLRFHGFADFELNVGDKRQALRNCVYPNIARYILKRLEQKGVGNEKEG